MIDAAGICKGGRPTWRSKGRLGQARCLVLCLNSGIDLGSFLEVRYSIDAGLVEVRAMQSKYAMVQARTRFSDVSLGKKHSCKCLKHNQPNTPYQPYSVLNMHATSPVENPGCAEYILRSSR